MEKKEKMFQREETACVKDRSSYKSSQKSRTEGRLRGEGERVGKYLKRGYQFKMLIKV